MSTPSLKAIRLDRSLLAGAAVVLAALAVAVLLGRSAPLRKLEYGLADLRCRHYPAKYSAKESPIVIVDIDDVSDDELQAVWPWPRSYYARLIRNLYRAGARAVVLDIEFYEPRQDYPRGDDSLEQAIRRHPDVIIGGKILYESWDLRSGGLVRDENAKVTLYLPYHRFLNADSSNWALTNVDPDMDGVVRQYYTRRNTAPGEPTHPTLAVRAFELLTGGRVQELGPSFRIAYPGPARSFPYHSFSHVVDDDEFWTAGEEEWGEATNWFDSLRAQEAFRDKVVFVGASMKELHDYKLTPFSAGRGAAAVEVPGVEVHAAALHTLLNGYRLRDADSRAVYAALAALCLLLYAVGVVAPTWLYALALAAAAGLWVAGSWRIYAAADILVPAATPLLTLLLTAAGQQGYLFYREQGRRREVVGMFGKFVPPGVVQQLIKDPSKAKLSGERRELTVMFTDVEGFTSIAEAMEPEAVAALLNDYLTPMSEIILAEGGIIDKFEGDLIMAEFGIPLAMPDHAVRACRAALAMQKRLGELNEVWKAQGKPLLRARTGIGSGPMVFGNMGSTQVFDYTVLGDVVNLASRLEGVNKAYGSYMLVNERTAELVKDQMLVREMDLLLVKGKHRPEKCYELVAPADSPDADAIRRVSALFAEGLALYRRQQWDEASARFARVLEIWPDDRPSKVFVERCRAFKAAPPGADWDGVYEMKTK